MRKKILLVGDWRFPIYEASLAAGFVANGADFIPLKFHEGITRFYRFLPRFIRDKIVYLEYRINQGLYCRRFNRLLVDAVIVNAVNAVFLYTARYVTAKTINKIRQISPGCKVLLYTNDNPFGNYVMPRMVWRHFIRSVPIVDVVFSYRNSNILQFKRLNARCVSLLMSSFIKNVDVPCPSSVKKQYDVVYVGHYEDDGRLEVIEALHNSGLSIKIYGDPYSWSSVSSNVLDTKSIRPVYGEKYNQVLHKSKAALVFLSKKNKDDYTRRCFEIPASMTVIVAMETKFLKRLFVSGKEALFFTNTRDCIEQVNRVVRCDKLRSRIALAGYYRVVRDDHSNYGRARQVLGYV